MATKTSNEAFRERLAQVGEILQAARKLTSTGFSIADALEIVRCGRGEYAPESWIAAELRLENER